MMNSSYVATDLGKIHTIRTGTGPSLMLLSASGRSSRMFVALMKLLAPHFDVCAIDTPGFGNSDPLPSGTTIEAIAQSVLQVLDGLDIRRTHLYGLHTGNKIATALVGSQPDRVDRLILAGQSHSLIPDQNLRNATILDIVHDHFDPPVSGPGHALVDWTASFQRLSAIWWNRRLVANAGIPESLEHARRLAMDELQSGGTAELYRANFAYDLGAGFTRITVPTLLLEITTPSEDKTIGRQGEIVQRMIPGAALQTITEPAGHTLTLENRARDLADILTSYFLTK